MSPSRDRPRDRDELESQLDDLEATLSELRSELRSERRRGPPKPPSLSELLRFTEEYTIPTLIALLEATIQSLELLRRTLRLADPERALDEERKAARNRLDRVGTEAGTQFAGALSELRAALSEADLPENPESRRLIEDARELTGDIEGRLRDAEQSVRNQRDRERHGNRPDRRDGDSPNRGVMIDVREAGAADEPEETSAESDDSEPPAVDVESELESIKDELDRSQQALDAANKNESPRADGDETTNNSENDDESDDQ